MTERVDAVVIGGGPAGAAAAIVLARAGASVVVLEREREVRAKVCGEFVSVEACAAARGLGVDPVALGAAPIDRVRVTWNGARADAGLPFLAASVSRERFDSALLEAARHAGADVRMGARALRLDGGAVVVRCGDAESVVTADTFVLASGKTEFGARRASGADGGAVGFKMHYALPKASLAELGRGVDLTLFAGGYAGMQRIEDDRAAFAYVVRDPRDVRTGASALDAIARSAPRMSRLLAGARALWPKPLAVSGVPYGFVYRGTDGPRAAYRAGDAFCVIPSFTGDGIAIALVTGRAAAEAALAGESAGRFHARMRGRVRVPMAVAGALGSAIRSPLGRASVVWPARLAPGIFSFVATQTRVSA